jgi:tRNA G46 methylase TrmB
MLSGEELALYRRVVVELGMGDGRLLESLARTDDQTLFVGIEIDREQCKQAGARISATNVILLNDSFEQVISNLPDECVDLFMAILPDPAFIDASKYDHWRDFYARVLCKLKPGGTLQIVTELTDELLQPVSDSVYEEWIKWLEQAFTSLGFSLDGVRRGSPPEYSSRCLDQFRGDTERIRMVTTNFRKL